jgi:hypothetical protein
MPAQKPAARAGEDRRPTARCRVELVERGADALGDRAVDRVAGLGPVERDQQDAVAALGEDSLVGHGPDPKGPVAVAVSSPP